jgi:hypothetical protein
VLLRAGARFATVFFAVVRFAGAFLAVVRFAVVRFAAVFLAVLLRAGARFATVFFAVVRFVTAFLAVPRFAAAVLAVPRRAGAFFAAAFLVGVRLAVFLGAARFAADRVVAFFATAIVLLLRNQLVAQRQCQVAPTIASTPAHDTTLHLKSLTRYCFDEKPQRLLQ